MLGGEWPDADTQNVDFLKAGLAQPPRVSDGPQSVMGLQEPCCYRGSGCLP